MYVFPLESYVHNADRYPCNVVASSYKEAVEIYRILFVGFVKDSDFVELSDYAYEYHID